MERFIFRKDLLSQQNSYPCYLKRYCIKTHYNSIQPTINKISVHNSSMIDKNDTDFNHNKQNILELSWDQQNGFPKYPERQKNPKINLLDQKWIASMSKKTFQASHKVRNIRTALFGNIINSRSQNVLNSKRSFDKFQQCYGNNVNFTQIKEKWIKKTKQLRNHSRSNSKSDRTNSQKQFKTSEQRKRHKVLKKQFKNYPAVGDYQIFHNPIQKKIIRNVDFSIKIANGHRKNQSQTIPSSNSESLNKIVNKINGKSQNKKKKKNRAFDYLGNGSQINQTIPSFATQKLKIKHIPLTDGQMNKLWLQTLKKYKISENSFACSIAAMQ